MKYLATIYLLAITSVAFAEPPGQLAQVQGLSSEMGTLATEVPGLTTTIQNTLTNDANYKKEAKVYVDDQKQKLAALEVAKTNVVTTVRVPVEQKQNEQAAQYNAQCNRQFDRDKEMDGYNHCINWKAELEAQFERNKQWWANYTVQWNHQNVDPVNAVIVKQNARLAELNKLSTVNAEAWTRATERMKIVRARIEQIAGIVSGFCHSENLSGEAMKWCTNVDWDGARRNLPPLTTSGTGGASANQ
jgi:hypothetical protein